MSAARPDTDTLELAQARAEVYRDEAEHWRQAMYHAQDELENCQGRLKRALKLADITAPAHQLAVRGKMRHINGTDDLRFIYDGGIQPDDSVAHNPLPPSRVLLASWH